MTKAQVNVFATFHRADLVNEMKHLRSITLNENFSDEYRGYALSQLKEMKGALKYFQAAEEAGLEVNNISLYDLMVQVMGESQANQIFAPTVVGNVRETAGKVKDYAIEKSKTFSERIGDAFYALAGKKQA